MELSGDNLSWSVAPPDSRDDYFAIITSNHCMSWTLPHDDPILRYMYDLFVQSYDDVYAVLAQHSTRYPNVWLKMI